MRCLFAIFRQNTFIRSPLSDVRVFEFCPTLGTTDHSCPLLACGQDFANEAAVGTGYCRPDRTGGLHPRSFNVGFRQPPSLPNSSILLLIHSLGPSSPVSGQTTLVRPPTHRGRGNRSRFTYPVGLGNFPVCTTETY